jgi:hypothetical protein
MTKILAFLVPVAALCAMLLVATIGFHNTEVSLRNAFDNKIEANKTDFDNMWKTIAQVAQVPGQYKADFKDTFESYVKARQGGTTGEGELLSFLSEAVPQYDAQALYSKVQTVVEAKRESWTTRQKELIDLKRQHDDLITQVPGNVFAAVLGRQAFTLQLVTSEKTDEAFESGRDENVELF